ncbi:mechanosensitive ion channel domain-containing protein [Luteimonas sp. MJ204]|uniref:mechanosensitive ion channel domain-containing protein n=1 Tax=Luteimonas sp. MJ145 TaxID=3129234 RepID=UPI0031BA0ACF
MNTTAPLAALLSLLLSLAAVAGAPAYAQASAPAPTPTAAGTGTTPDTAESADSADTADTADTGRDLADSRRVAERLQETDGLADVTVTVRDGVAELQGVVLAPEDRERAAQVVEQQPGISRVDNRVMLSTRISDRIGTASTLALDKIVRLVAALPLLIVAMLVVALAWSLGKWLGRRFGQRIQRRNWQSENPYFASLVQQLVQWLVLLGGILVALDLLGATALVGAVMGSAGVIGLALGFAFKDIAENYVAGVLLSIRRPFAPGDSLRIDGSHEGKVAALTPRATVLVTFDGNRLTLPNALVFKSVVLNFSSNARRRLDFTIPVDVAESIRCVHDLALSAIRGVDGVLADPGPSWTVDAYDASAITLRFFAWIDQRSSDLGKVRSEAIHSVRTRLAEAGVSTPRVIQYAATLPEESSAAGAAARAVQAPAAEEAAADTSVNRDLDEHIAAEQQAHANEDLLPVESEASPPHPAP